MKCPKPCLKNSKSVNSKSHDVAEIVNSKSVNSNSHDVAMLNKPEQSRTMINK